MTAHPLAKPICFYLPQFHRTEENDRWWGEGFTEWTLVQGAGSLFEGHRQPVAPHDDIGYYDLTDPEVRRRQGDMARSHGIHGFCYYHYWFGGTRLLHEPLERMLADGYPDLPFCLCWANEPWSRRWSGEDHDVLQSQHYGETDEWVAHFEVLARFFEDDRYLCVDGCPVFAIYRIGHIPNADGMIACWRHLAVERGFAGLHVVALENAFADAGSGVNCADATAEHQPSAVLGRCRPLVTGGLNVVSVEETWRLGVERKGVLPVHYRGACHAWDNTPRRGRHGTVVLASRPERFRMHLSQLFEMARKGESEPLVFLNAWNEWSEGAYLEPDQEHGYRWLECIDGAHREPVTRVALRSTSLPTATRPLPGRFATRARPDPDVDLINTLMMHGAKARCVVDFGCADGASSEHLRNFTGADRYIGLEPDPALARTARARLDEVHVVDGDVPDLAPFSDAGIDFVVCNELLGRCADPLEALISLRGVLDRDGLACLGFDHAGHHARLAALLAPPGHAHGGDPDTDVPRRYTMDEARALVVAAGFEVDKVYRVFEKRRDSGPVGAVGNAVGIGSATLTGLDRAQVDNLFCLRFLLIARAAPGHAREPVAVGAERELETPAAEGGESLSSYERYRARVNEAISPHDSLFNVYARSASEEEYFSSAFRQLDLVDEMLRRHCDTELSAIHSMGDYACHFGRLLRAMRAMRPDVELHAYDIDPDAVAFCATQFGCAAEVTHWSVDASTARERHELLTCASLLTHTGIEFFESVLALWSRLLKPGGLMCFTYLGADYPARWLRGELDHYGFVEPSVRREKAMEFERNGHALAGFGTLYSPEGDYGVGFMAEAVVSGVLGKHPELDYLGTIPGDANAFNQDLALVRKRLPRTS